LVIEARSIGRRLDTAGTAWRSIERNLGTVFADFADLLVVSDAAHATRRSMEIGEAVEFARGHGLKPFVATAAADVLSRLGMLWDGSAGLVAGDANPEIVLEHALWVFTDGAKTATIDTVPRP
jgi:hypothetical protein